MVCVNWTHETRGFLRCYQQTVNGSGSVWVHVCASCCCWVHFLIVFAPDCCVRRLIFIVFKRDQTVQTVNGSRPSLGFCSTDKNLTDLQKLQQHNQVFMLHHGRSKLRCGFLFSQLSVNPNEGLWLLDLSDIQHATWTRGMFPVKKVWLNKIWTFYFLSFGFISSLLWNVYFFFLIM